ncbi:type II toxin-antitoxin system PemK/MazF family toxin [Furfurilactobacillus cerevisiae]|uniref:type II toxin-antitoxin system PemK/MazF family toxin n=1 Tax=Furfurilactobacillus rossiae TaxID=231049 RepID=UPI003B97F0F0
MKKYTKRKHIKLFETIYYNADENNFKIGQLPVWIDTYAHWLDKEVNTGLPQYYREFHQGMLVMINFGVRVGSELSGPHFGVVLTHNDDKYHRTLLVAPLTSHGKEYHVDLGTECKRHP